eukprot:363429-Chlamydomonas_euryale.AAC.25
MRHQTACVKCPLDCQVQLDISMAYCSWDQMLALLHLYRLAHARLPGCTQGDLSAEHLTVTVTRVAISLIWRWVSSKA